MQPQIINQQTLTTLYPSVGFGGFLYNKFEDLGFSAERMKLLDAALDGLSTDALRSLQNQLSLGISVIAEHNQRKADKSKKEHVSYNDIYKITDSNHVLKINDSRNFTAYYNKTMALRLDSSKVVSVYSCAKKELNPQYCINNGVISIKTGQEHTNLRAMIDYTKGDMLGKGMTLEYNLVDELIELYKAIGLGNTAESALSLLNMKARQGEKFTPMQIINCLRTGMTCIDEDYLSMSKEDKAKTVPREASGFYWDFVGETTRLLFMNSRGPSNTAEIISWTAVPQLLKAIFDPMNLNIEKHINNAIMEKFGHNKKITHDEAHAKFLQFAKNSKAGETILFNPSWLAGVLKNLKNKLLKDQVNMIDYERLLTCELLYIGEGKYSYILRQTDAEKRIPTIEALVSNAISLRKVFSCFGLQRMKEVISVRPMNPMTFTNFGKDALSNCGLLRGKTLGGIARKLDFEATIDLWSGSFSIPINVQDVYGLKDALVKDTKKPGDFDNGGAMYHEDDGDFSIDYIPKYIEVTKEVGINNRNDRNENDSAEDDDEPDAVIPRTTKVSDMIAKRVRDLDVTAQAEQVKAALLGEGDTIMEDASQELVLACVVTKVLQGHSDKKFSDIITSTMFETLQAGFAIKSFEIKGSRSDLIYYLVRQPWVNNLIGSSYSYLEEWLGDNGLYDAVECALGI